MELDYIIVGFGLAGMSMAKVLEDQQRKFMVINNQSQVSSRVAAGVFNPVILKRFTPVWNADEQLQNLHPFYEDLSQKLHQTYTELFDTYKVFKSIEDQNNWYMACDKPVLTPYLVPQIIHEPMHGILHYHGFGKVIGTGRVHINRVLNDYQQYLMTNHCFLNQTFEYDQLQLEEDGVVYQNLKAKKIIFAEGFGLKENPFFNYLPLTGTKGEMMVIHSPDLKLTSQLKSALFILPMGNDEYWVGATFNWTDKTIHATEGGKIELEEKLASMITVPYTIVSQFGGIRPTVKDRRPLLGVHPKHKSLVVFNGLGTRGVMLAPTLSAQLFQFLENKTPLDKEISIDRFN